MIYALEGPIAITECGVDDHRCNQSDSCHAQGNWSVINRAIRNALESVSLAELSRPVAAEEISIPLHRVARRRPAELAE